jgi:16S rRNA (uracil1498-N3)-methyltransferase
LAGPLKAGSELVLDPAEAQHLTGALRRRQGDLVILADGAGRVADARVLRIVRGRVEVRIEAVKAEPRPPSPGVTLALAALHGQAMDWAVQKAVEIGAMQLIPVLTRRSQASLTVASRRWSHWQRVAQQAIKQCRRPWAMELCRVLTLEQLLQQYESRPGIVACIDGESVDRLGSEADTVLLIGPEGGLASSEMQLLEEHLWRKLRLGRYTLRAETAAVVGTALLITALESRASARLRADE